MLPRQVLYFNRIWWLCQGRMLHQLFQRMMFHNVRRKKAPRRLQVKLLSDPPTPLPVSRVPSARAEDVADYDAYQKHVQSIVNQWLVGKQSQHSNPNYEQNALTSFLLMVLISSFLETAQDAVKETYAKLNEKQMGMVGPQGVQGN